MGFLNSMSVNSFKYIKKHPLEEIVVVTEVRCSLL